MGLPRLGTRLREAPDLLGGRGWDGEEMFIEFRQDEARAFVSVSGSQLGVGSCWTGRVPDLTVLQMALDLQGRLIRRLRETCPGVPPESAWHLHAEPDEMDAQLGRSSSRTAEARR